MSKGSRKYDRPLFRRELPIAKQSEAKLFLIVVEGKVTEPQYLIGLRDRLRLSSTHIHVQHAKVTDPQNIILEAEELRKERRALAKKSPFAADFDEVWVVFDTEAQNHPRRIQLPGALALAKKYKILVAQSNPCFEFWLLLHYTFTTSPLLDARAAISKLRRFIPTYKKTQLPIDELMEKVKDAVKHTSLCAQHHKAVRGDGNPSSYLHLLVQSLNESAVPSFRCL